MVSSNS